MKIKGYFIKQLREANGYKRAKLGSMVGYSRCAIWNLEVKGNARAEIELLARLAILFNVSIEDMIDMDEVYEELKRIKLINAKIPTIS